MEPLRVCVCLSLFFALTFASGCDPNKNFQSTTFDSGVYISARPTIDYEEIYEFERYSFGKNIPGVVLPLGPLLIQVEKSCSKNKFQDKLVLSRKLPDKYTNEPPQPKSPLLKLDYQLGKSGEYYTKTVLVFPWISLKDTINKFINELKCSNKSIQDQWYHFNYKGSLFWYEIRIPKMNSYLRKGPKCPPDDSNIERLCNTDTVYSCPKMTFEETKGVSVRNVSMYIVTGEPSPGKECSFNHARYTQYIGNHYYFMGNNTQSKRMHRTVPVMTKSIRVTSHNETCPKKYQMQFYINTAHLDETDLPCPTQPGVLLQKVENMEIYVKTFNGNPDTDMSQATSLFTTELDNNNLPYIHGRHYIAQYRGHGPMFGRTMEIWVEKTAPNYVKVC